MRSGPRRDAALILEGQFLGIELPIRKRLMVWDHSGCRGYIQGNGHTHPGRFQVVWGDEDTYRLTSIGDLSRASKDALIWLDGFLCGSEPAYFELYPDDPDDDFVEEHYDDWRSRLDDFRRRGVFSFPTNTQP